MMNAMILGLVLAAVPVQAAWDARAGTNSKCGVGNNWANPATGESGACLCDGTGSNCAWHCPWESAGLVSGFGCAKSKYDCGDTGMTAALLAYYPSTKALEWGEERKQYVIDCINGQCNGGQMPPTPSKWDPVHPAGAAPAPTSTAPCNPGKCETGLTCTSDPSKCCGHFEMIKCCGGKAGRMYCPNAGQYSVMCNDGSCDNTEAECGAAGVKFGATKCPATARLLSV